MLTPKQYDIGHKIKPRRELDNPIVNAVFMPKYKWRESNLKSLSSSLLDKMAAGNMVDIPDELIDRLTYQVFQNIKTYLDEDMGKKSTQRHIKLDISL
jgi:hypothetical protein